MIFKFTENGFELLLKYFTDQWVHDSEELLGCAAGDDIFARDALHVAEVQFADLLVATFAARDLLEVKVLLAPGHGGAVEVVAVK